MTRAAAKQDARFNTMVLPRRSGAGWVPWCMMGCLQPTGPAHQTMAEHAAWALAHLQSAHGYGR